MLKSSRKLLIPDNFYQIVMSVVDRQACPNVRNVVLKALDYLDSCMVGDFAFMADAVQLFQNIVVDMSGIAENILEVVNALHRIISWPFSTIFKIQSCQ